MLFRFGEFGCIDDATHGQRWSPACFAAEVLNRVAALTAAKVDAGSTVIIAHSGSARFFADLFAVWSLGCTAACIDTALTESEVKTLIEFVKPSAVLVDEFVPDVQVDVRMLQLARAAGSAGFAHCPTIEPDRPALVLFTSGTTGNPKGVVLSFRALLNRIALNRMKMGPASRMKTLVTLPTSFGHGLIGNALTPFLSGGDIVLYPLGLALAQNLGRIVDQYRVGFLSSVPAFWRMTLKFSNSPASGSLVRVHVGSAPLSAELWSGIVEWSRADVANCYGVTELANWAAGASSRIEGIADGLVGRPWGGKAAIRDSTGAVREAGEGELLVRSPSLMTGYLHRTDLTAEVVVDGWYYTRDSAHIDDRGLITLTGRIKDEINRGGLKVQPAEVDALLESHPAVAEACVFGVDDEVSGEVVAAAVCLAPGENVGFEDLRDWCSRSIRREAVPERWFVVDKIPRNERGKINRDAVRRLLAGKSH